MKSKISYNDRFSLSRNDSYNSPILEAFTQFTSDVICTFIAHF